jgi:hypothetical protein
MASGEVGQAGVPRPPRGGWGFGETRQDRENEMSTLFLVAVAVLVYEALLGNADW